MQRGCARKPGERIGNGRHSKNQGKKEQDKGYVGQIEAECPGKGGMMSSD